MGQTAKTQREVSAAISGFNASPARAIFSRNLEPARDFRYIVGEDKGRVEAARYDRLETASVVICNVLSVTCGLRSIKRPCSRGRVTA